MRQERTVQARHYGGHYGALRALRALRITVTLYSTPFLGRAAHSRHFASAAPLRSRIAAGRDGSAIEKSRRESLSSNLNWGFGKVSP